ncbi:hypothetical protein AVEN_78709-1 [Araneus ventricosus]|uniref:Uncharacterized protein n=1 Tax=Araneus ventricosus TaxID=182803 RepID=A0A4Y2MNY9_ARAVE|nr:hypothetical protein AVEN_78709-1 [Araneus ventricosus]
MKFGILIYQENCRSVSTFGGQRASGSKSEATGDPRCMWAWYRLHLMFYAKRPPAVVVRKFGEGGANSGVVLVIRPLFKMTMPVPK